MMADHIKELAQRVSELEEGVALHAGSIDKLTILVSKLVLRLLDLESAVSETRGVDHGGVPIPTRQQIEALVSSLEERYR